MTRFRFGKKIGAGGMGLVRHATRLGPDGEEGDDELAQKSLLHQYLVSEEAIKRFKREVRLQSELDHPNVVPVVARNLSAVPPWFVMPYVPRSLKDELRSGRTGDIDWIKDVFRQILAGVGHAHERDVVHRDLKPGNVLIDDGVPKIADFGLGKSLGPKETRLTRTKQTMGTRRYMAPEQVETPKLVGKPADVYALGKVLCEMCSGRKPPELAVDLADVPREFHHFVGRCCERDPDRRYRDATDALAAFDVLLGAGDDVDDPPRERAEQLIREVDAALDDDPAEALARLSQHLLTYAEEEELYTRVVPRLPVGVVSAYVEHLHGDFDRVLTIYDAHIEGSLPFSYCDVVANFYRVVWEATEDLSVRKRVLARLIEIGASHSRWYVRDVVCDLVAGAKDAATAMMAAEVIDADPFDAAWHADAALERRLRAPIAGAFRRAVAKES